MNLNVQLKRITHSNLIINATPLIKQKLVWCGDLTSQRLFISIHKHNTLTETSKTKSKLKA